MVDSAHLAKTMGEDISRVLLEHKQRGDAVLFFLSAGSAFAPLEYIADEALDGYLTITMLDERYDTLGEHSNFAALSRTLFFKRAELCNVQVIDTCVVESESPRDLCARIEADVHAWLLEHPNGVLLATVGIGEDGHTAGIMPFPENPERFVQLFRNEQWFASYDAGEKNPIPLRVTATITLLQTLDQVFVYAIGESKHDALANMQTQGPLPECPARILPQLRAQFYLG